MEPLAKIRGGDWRVSYMCHHLSQKLKMTKKIWKHDICSDIMLNHYFFSKA
jgi:hypothetical protein